MKAEDRIPTTMEDSLDYAEQEAEDLAKERNAERDRWGACTGHIRQDDGRLVHEAGACPLHEFVEAGEMSTSDGLGGDMTRREYHAEIQRKMREAPEGPEVP